MRLEGIHHVTCVTADAPSNADFYVRVLGLRIVKKTVNQTDQTTYHIFYGDERASYGNNISFFEYRGRPDGRAGAGNVHTIVWRLGEEGALDFWERRLAGEGLDSERTEDALEFCDHEGLRHRLAVVEAEDAPLTGDSPEVPAEYALQGFDGVRAYATDAGASSTFMSDALEMSAVGESRWEARGGLRGGCVPEQARVLLVLVVPPEVLERLEVVGLRLGGPGGRDLRAVEAVARPHRGGSRTAGARSGQDLGRRGGRTRTGSGSCGGNCRRAGRPPGCRRAG